MLFGSLVKKIIGEDTHKRNTDNGKLGLRKSRSDKFSMKQIKSEILRAETYQAYDPNSLIEDYLLIKCQNSANLTSSSSPDDYLPREHIKINITPDDFEHIKVIGKGYFGKVTQVKFKKDGQIYALKSLKKSKLKEAKHIEHTITERKILEIIQYPFIVALRFAFQTEKKLYLVMDCHQGGELFYHLRSKGRFTESQAKFYLSQIILTLEFLHQKKIIYRDLKPENIMLDSTGYIKLTDFGLAKANIYEDSGCTGTFCGTPEYLAPEIICGEKYGKSVDIWCMGILFYEMLYGFPPFFDKNKEKLYKKIIFNEPDFTRNLCVKLSFECRDLLSRLLDKNQKTRIKISQVKTHRFFDGYDFNSIFQMKVIPPIIPDIKGSDDYKYIDPGLANEKAEDSIYNGCSPLVMKGTLLNI